MADTLITFYPHRRNRDGSFDSICFTCFATVVYAKSEAELVEYDRNHVCLPSTVSQLAFNRKVLERR
jgi:hypothetical protein